MGNACHPSDHARAQVAVKERQVLIDLAKDHLVSKQICTRKELITIFQTSFTSIEDNTAPDLSLMSLTILRNGGILLELPSKEVAQWLKTGTNCTKLATASGGDLVRAFGSGGVGKVPYGEGCAVPRKCDDITGHSHHSRHRQRLRERVAVRPLTVTQLIRSGGGA